MPALPADLSTSVSRRPRFPSIHETLTAYAVDTSFGVVGNFIHIGERFKPVGHHAWAQLLRLSSRLRPCERLKIAR